MFCYGRDNELVGVTGILGCLGLVYVGRVFMYAIHIPDNTSDLNALGGKTFAAWVENQEGEVGKEHGQLFAVLNEAGKRSSAMDEVTAVKKALNSPATIMYEIKKKRLPPPPVGTNDHDAVVTMFKRVHATRSLPSGTLIYYKPHSQVTWEENKDNGLTGQYKIMSGFTHSEKPTDLEFGWGG
jgi:hypothetical protein